GVVRPSIAGVLEGSGWFDELVFLDRKGPWSRCWLAVAARLRHHDVDLAILFPNSLRSAVAAWLGRCRRRVGYARSARSFLLTQTHESVRDARGKLRPSPVMLAYSRLVEAVGCPVSSNRMELFTTARDEAAA